MRTPATPLLALGLPLLVLGAAGTAAEEPTAWELLADVRKSVAAAAPLEADFEQTFLPAGFDSGDSETGRMTLALPECLRWDYLEPYPRTYLLCGRTARSWNPGEPVGRRQVLSPEDETGLELIRLDVAELESQYSATLSHEPGERVRIALTPASAGNIRDAEIEIDLGAARVLSLTFLDREGNRTRFGFSGYRKSEEPRPFEPPPALDWLDG